jgi:hypothetical protein
MKNNAIFGHVDLKKKSLDIINNNIFHYLMSKNSFKHTFEKKIQVKCFNYILGIIFDLILWFQKLWQFVSSFGEIFQK